MNDYDSFWDCDRVDSGDVVGSCLRNKDVAQYYNRPDIVQVTELHLLVGRRFCL